MILLSQLSKKTKVSVSTIRQYEKLELISSTRKTPEDSKHYTYFDEETIDKIEIIEEGRSIGLSFDNIKELVDVWFNKRISHKARLNILLKQREAIDEKIRQLQDSRDRLDIFIKEIEEFI